MLSARIAWAVQFINHNGIEMFPAPYHYQQQAQNSAKPH